MGLVPVDNDPFADSSTSAQPNLVPVDNDPFSDASDAPDGATSASIEKKDSLSDLSPLPAAGDLGEVTKGLSLGFDKDVGAGIYAAHQALQKGHVNDLAKDYSEGRQNLIDEEKSQEEKKPWTSFIEQLAGSLPTAAAGDLGPAKSVAGAVAKSAVHGATQLGLQGVGNAPGDVSDRLNAGQDNAELGAGIGGTLSAIGKGAKGIYNAFISPGLDKQTVEDLSKQGLNLTPGQVMGKNGASVEGFTSQAPFSGIPLRKTYQDQRNALQDQISDVSGQSQTTPVTQEEAGNKLLSGLKQAHQNFINKKNSLYDSAFKNVDQNTPIQTDETQAALNRIFSQYGGNDALQDFAGSKGAGLGKLQDAIDDPNGIPLKVAKTKLKGLIADAAKGAEDNNKNTLAGEFWDVYHSLDRDILQTAHAQDPAAVGKIADADKFLTERIQQNSDLRKMFDPNNPSKVKASNAYMKLLNMTTEGKSADSGTLQVLKDNLPSSEWDAVKQYHLSNLGQDKNGEFSLAQFTKNASKITPEAKNLYFDGNADKLKAFDNLVKYSKAIKFSSVNPSGSGAALGEIGSVLGVAGLTHSPAVLAPSALNFMYGQLVAKPWAAKLINQLPRNISTVSTNKAVQSGVFSVLRSLHDASKDDPDQTDDGSTPKFADGGTVGAPDDQFTPENLNKFSQNLQNIGNNPFDPHAPILHKIKMAESNGDDNAVNPNSTASGPYQFTNPTWKAMVKKYGDQEGIGVADKGKADAQETMAGLLLKDNESSLTTSLGRSPTNGELYMAHFLGAEGAKRLIQNVGTNTPVTYLFPPSYIRANRQIFLKGTQPRTADEVYATLANKI